MLVRSVMTARRAFGWALGGVLALQLGATGVLVLRSCDADVPIAPHDVTTIATVALPMVIPIPIETTRSVVAATPSCPIPRRDAPTMTPSVAEQVLAVRPAPSNAGWIAAWNDEHVFVSTDAGATFTRMLDGDGSVTDVSFDCWGHVLVLRGKHLGVRDNGAERWQDIPALRGKSGDAGVILGGGPDVVVIGDAPGDDWRGRMAISSDLGATGRYREILDAFESGMHAQGWQDANGTIHAALSTADCMSDELAWITIRGDDVESSHGGMSEGSSFAIYGDDLVVSYRSWRTRAGEWHELT